MSLVEWYYKKVSWLATFLSIELPPGPRCVPMRIPINIMKGMTPVVILSAMKYYNNEGFGPSIYLALHGSYGLVWLLKEKILPDFKWEEKITLPSCVMVVLTLALYWRPGLVLIRDGTFVSPRRAALAIFIHTMGVLLMIASDTQKFFTLKYKKGLISEGWFARSRNTNYLGEITLYSSYCLLAQDKLSWVYYIFLWTTLFFRNMMDKEKSLMKKEGWQDYQRKSNFFFPKLF
eukprot:TRINITY_DN13202_c0_g1_i1.p1 TRINITY_DN13202_c0_g1~~TRINITY_DN13202_c0_g1_i1.p1  ORF type:complete len:233 (+),score=47.67 TRINITY_DN13202_c0_g1_i1:18-716(+)